MVSSQLQDSMRGIESAGFQIARKDIVAKPKDFKVIKRIMNVLNKK